MTILLPAITPVSECELLLRKFKQIYIIERKQLSQKPPAQAVRSTPKSQISNLKSQISNLKSQID